MRKKIIWLSLHLLLGMLLIGCSTQFEEPDGVVDPPPADLTDEPTAVPEVTGTSLPEPTLTQTVLPTIAETTTTALPEFTANATELVRENNSTTSISERDMMEMVYIPGGEFIMGANDNDAINTTTIGHDYNESPPHTVYLDSFWIDKYEVTNSQYSSCVEAGACDPPYQPGSETRQRYYNDPQYADYPVIWVNLYMAQDYCEWVGRRVPNEAEWEKAARGPDGNKYPWGNDFVTNPLSNELANFCDINCPRTISNPGWDDGYADTSPVGSYPAGASPYGVMDMAGNVWEWTTTAVSLYPYDPDDGREDLTTQDERIWRGGTWSNGIWYLRTTVRHYSPAWYWFVNLGFRCVSSE